MNLTTEQVATGTTAQGTGGVGSSRAGAGGAVSSDAPPPRTKEHYKIEIKAWIPHAKVVDPEEPLRVTDWLQTVDDILENLPGSSFVDPEYWFHSFYRGDSHGDYAGSHRVRSVVEFDWDGKVISGFKTTGDFGQSHREWEAKAWLDTIVGKYDLGYWFDAESDRATSEVSGSGGGNRFAIGLKSGNPLLMTVNPDINADLTGSIAPDGGLSLHYETDSFPSHGVQVSRDGNVIHTGITNDASGVAVLGPVGAANIGTSLMRPAQWKGNSGGMVLPGGGVTGSIPTK